MSEHRWFDVEQGSQPWARSNASEMICPFCGGQTLKQSFGDVLDDQLRVELYCDNGNCEVREMTVLARRIDSSLRRADVQALEAVDDYGMPKVIGPPDGATLDDVETARARNLRVRTAPARITVNPL